MGFSFAAIRKDLGSERFRRFYRSLKTECPELLSFPDHDALLLFFHDETQDLDRKDAILFELFTLYRIGSRYLDLAPFFIVLFTPALVSIYAHGKRKCPGIDQEDLLQEICLQLIQVIQEIEIVPYKVAARIVGALRNRVRALLNRRLREEFSGLAVDLGDGFEAIRSDAAGPDEELVKIERDMPDMIAILDHLVRIRRITGEDKKMIIATFVEGKSLNVIATSSTEYERLKKRRQRSIQTIKSYLSKQL